MNSITVTVPNLGHLSLDSFGERLAVVAESRDRRPFSEETVRFCSGLSKALLSYPEGKAFPQMMSLGYWLRNAAVERLRESYDPLFRSEGLVRVPRGLAFHLPPANVDTLFVYSWVLALLAGNTNVVRLPTEPNEVTSLLLSTIEETAPSWLSERNLFITYEHDDEITALISAHCDIRVVWGGDEKINHIRSVPLPPSATDLNFANRHSIAAIKAEALRNLDGGEIDNLAHHFHNDVFWFDQMGCASPRLVIWVGNAEGVGDNSEQFYRRLAAVAVDKGYEVDTGTALSKISHAYRSLIDRPVGRYRTYGNVLTVLELDRPWFEREDVHGAGVLLHAEIGELNEIVPLLSRTDQTMTYFGFDADELHAFVNVTNGRGIDRIVPVGQALNFHHIWDGFDLLLQFSRAVQVQ